MIEINNCACGKEGRYQFMEDGEIISSCNKYLPCPTYEDQSMLVGNLNEELEVYRRFVNQIVCGNFSTDEVREMAVTMFKKNN